MRTEKSLRPQLERKMNQIFDAQYKKNSMLHSFEKIIREIRESTPTFML
jgi:hypothetical protein